MTRERPSTGTDADADLAPLPSGDESARECLLSSAGCVPIGPCPRCEREALAYADVEDDSRFLCVHCDERIRVVAWRDEADLQRLGYDVTDPAAGGCATGCASGGCGTLALADLRAAAVVRRQTTSS